VERPEPRALTHSSPAGAGPRPLSPFRVQDFQRTRPEQRATQNLVARIGSLGRVGQVRMQGISSGRKRASGAAPRRGCRSVPGACGSAGGTAPSDDYRSPGEGSREPRGTFIPEEGGVCTTQRGAHLGAHVCRCFRVRTLHRSREGTARGALIDVCRSRHPPHAAGHPSQPSFLCRTASNRFGVTDGFGRIWWRGSAHPGRDPVCPGPNPHTGSHRRAPALAARPEPSRSRSGV